MTLKTESLFNTITSTFKITNKAPLALYSPSEIYRRLREAKQDYSWSELKVQHAAAKKEYDDLRILEKNILTRASPLLPKAIRLGLKHPDVSLLDYEEWFGGRAANYARPGEVSSMFSPAAYLAELYREARGLYKDNSLFHIDIRRPDLKNLVLSQENLDSPVSALSLSNEILMEKVAAVIAASTESPPEHKGGVLAGEGSNEDVWKSLSEHVTSAGTPYHHHHTRLRQVQKQKDPEFTMMASAPQVVKHLKGPTLAGMYYDIPPTLHSLLTEEITAANADEMFEKYFPGMTPEVMAEPKVLRAWFGLTDEEVNAFVSQLEGDAEYVNNVLTTRLGNDVVQLETAGTSPSGYYHYVRLYPVGGGKWRLKFKPGNFSATTIDIGVNNSPPGITRKTIRAIDYGETHFRSGKEYFTTIEWPYEGVTSKFSLSMLTLNSGGVGWEVICNYNFRKLPAHAFLLKLNKAIRLYKVTGLSPRVLEEIVTSVNPDQITDETLEVLARTAQMMNHYGVSHEDALVMARGNISQTAKRGEFSHFDRLFNLLPPGEESVVPVDIYLNMMPDSDGSKAPGNENESPEQSELLRLLKLALARVCGTDSEGLHKLFGCIMDADINNGYVRLYANNTSLSRMYAVSLWARQNGLSPAELYSLLRMLGLKGTKPQLRDVTADVWNAWLQRVTAAVTWLNARGWTVGNLELMTRSVTGIPAGTDITNLLASLRTAVAAAKLPEDPTPADYARPLAPLLAAAFNLPGDVFAGTLLLWANKAKPGDIMLKQAWEILGKTSPSDDDTTAMTAFAYGLAQTALIVHATGVTSDALALFVESPDLLSATAADGDGTALARSVDTIMALGDFSDWLKTLPDAAGAGASLVGSLSGGITPALLAQAAALPPATVTQAAAEANKKGDVKDAAKLASWAEIRVVRQWLSIALAFGVMPADIGRLVALDYLPDNKKLSTWEDWKTVADAFSAGLSPAQARVVEENQAFHLSGALSGYLLSSGVFTGTGVSSREELFTYLLSDNLNGPQVKTSRLAEAICSLQVFIHRVLNLSVAGIDPESQMVQRVVLDRQFFRDWVRWNARYSTWAASQKLMYYPENYIDPIVRLGQTRMMDDMLQVLGQAQVNTDTVGDAFMGYLTGFEEVANLETIGAYHDSEDPDEGKTWFVGSNQSTPREFWWRYVDEGKRNSEGTLPANAWVGWEKITCSAQPFRNLIRPVIYKKRLYLGWVEREEHILSRDEKGLPDKYEYRWSLKISWLRYDGGWSMPAVYEYPSLTVELLELWLSQGAGLSFYLSAWMTQQSMVSGLYRTSATAQTCFTAGVNIFEDMSFGVSNVGEANWAALRQFMDSSEKLRVVQPFGAKAPSVENKLTGPSALPAGFTQFDISAPNITIVDVSDEGDKYRIKMGLTQTVDKARPEVQNEYISYLIKHYPELQNETAQVQVLFGQDTAYLPGALIIRKESNQWWAYLLSDYWGYRSGYSISDGPFSYEDSCDLTQVPDAPGAVPHVAKFRLSTGDYPFAGMEFQVYVKGVPSYRVTAVNLVGHSPPPLESKITPAAYASPPGIIPKNQVVCNIDQFGYLAIKDIDLRAGAASHTWSNKHVYPAGAGLFTFSGTEKIHTVKLTCGTGKSRTWKLRVYKASGALQVDVIGSEYTDGERAQYLEHGQIQVRTRLNTLFARQLTERAANGIDAILNYDTQEIAEPPLYGGDARGMMDFSGANAIYFWELFYYTPMMIMQRFLQEERFDQAEQWLKYIFSPSGYIVHGTPVGRLWNTRPLEEDTSWNDEPLKSYDPDAVAQNDPMHYKLNAFMRALDIIIGRGDTSYRKLERDTLVEAKAWYGRALDLLGEAPWIAPGDGWGNPALSEVANPTSIQDHIESLALMAQGVRPESALRPQAGEGRAMAGTTLFLPEANTVMLGYWETLRIRLYNLRHNLTLDGQPLSLPLYAPPADPKALLAAAVAAEGGAGSELPSVTSIPALRFTPLLDSARSMASQLIGFGSAMQQILISQDAEALAELLVTQGADIADSSLSLQKRTLEELTAERVALDKSREVTIARRDHYQNLFNENMNEGELRAMEQLEKGQKTASLARTGMIAAAALNMAPNTFGLANGGSRWGAVGEALALGFTIEGETKVAGATRLAQEEQYRRRREEWKIQYDLAVKEIEAQDKQGLALDVRYQSAEMQIAHMETQAAHASAQLALFRSKFTGKAMYSWLRGRLATIFYQYYDLTASLCLMAQKSLQWEKGDTTSYLKTGTWNGAWSGLMSGEGLMLSLAQMEMAWMRHQKRELEVTRTVSLAGFFAGKLQLESDTPLTLSGAINQLLAGKNEKTIGSGMNTVALVKDATGDTNFKLGINFSLKDLGAGVDYPQHTLRVRSIAVTLPALLGPYQDVRARLRTNVAETQLPTGCNESAISHALQDNGLFAPDGTGDARWGARWLPFEGLDVNDESGMTLSFADALGDQKALLESLTDAILHIQFTVR